MVKKQECSFCHRAITFGGNFKEGVRHCCDACAVQFIESGMRSTDLMRCGISFPRAVRLGYDPMMTCPVCHQDFIPRGGNQTRCRKEGCLSAAPRGKRKPMKITKQYKDQGEPACKTVICVPMNAYRDQLIEAFPVITQEEFNETRKIIMNAACKDYVYARGMATAIFYMTSSRLHRKLISQDNLTSILGSSSVTLRYYIKQYGHLFGMSIKKRKRMT
jgi:hypothetical protein